MDKPKAAASGRSRKTVLLHLCDCHFRTARSSVHRANGGIECSEFVALLLERFSEPDARCFTGACNAEATREKIDSCVTAEGACAVSHDRTPWQRHVHQQRRCEMQNSSVRQRCR
ncbi:hypothetical protein K9U02_18010 [Xanthomonas arboricola pv. pruni]|uniref:hypothetical protein n=1 Tax=Xanthomonas arboricola TaxID=56448 RepID=UPI00163C8141|nr:hypothetical protein [Xanthomonas arboricola]UJO10644.1 hypothetical protein K9U02_18010 [Xanthomonas arboricola pv. pruni]